MSYYVIISINLALFALTAIIAAYRFSELNKALKFLAISCCINFIGELAACVAAFKLRNNMQVYAVLNLLDVVFIGCYFHHAIGCFKRRSIILYLTWGTFTLGILNAFFLQPLSSLNNNFLYLKGAMIIFFCLCSMSEQLLISETQQTEPAPHFLIAALYMCFWILSFLYWGLYKYMYLRFEDFRGIINNFMIIVCVVMNVTLSVVFLMYPKKEARYV